MAIPHVTVCLIDATAEVYARIAKAEARKYGDEIIIRAFNDIEYRGEHCRYVCWATLNNFPARCRNTECDDWYNGESR